MASIYDESVGVFEGTLMEDMIDTVKETRRPYVKVSLPGVFDDNEETNPLVYVPSWLTILPLLKGAKVLIKFSQGNHPYPYLYKILDLMNNDMTSDLSMPSSGDYVKIPEPEKVIYVQKYSDTCFLFSTKNYTLIRNNLTYTILTSDSLIETTKTYSVLAQDINLEASNKLLLKSTSSELVTLGNKIDTLGSLLEKLVNNCFTSTSFTTEGSPGSHKLTSSTEAKIRAWLEDFKKVFE